MIGHMDEKKMKHLDYIENTIARMNQCSFKIKELMGVVIAAFLAIYAATYSAEVGGKKELLLIAIVPTVIFWIIDAYYLYQERLFRELFKDVAGLNGKSEIKDFDMSTDQYDKGFLIYMKAFASSTELSIYCVSILILILICYFN